MNPISILRILLIAATAVFVIYFIKDLLAHKEELKGKDRVLPLSIIGAITDFFDTWGIGCFATTQAGFKFTNTCKDELMPGTLNVGHLVPVVLEAGQSMMVEAGSELLMRSGTVKIASGTFPVLVNATSGNSLDVGEGLNNNNLYVAPMEGVVVTAFETSMIMVHGMYAVA